MVNHKGFYFIPKQWLGDANIIAMDWDCKAMHLHLMSIAWQQTPKGYLLDDEIIIKKLLGNPDLIDWENRIKPQIFKSWKKTILTIENKTLSYWYQPGLIKNLNQNNINTTKEIKVRKKKNNPIEIETPLFEGFNLSKILNSKVTTTILHEQSSNKERETIWTIGVELVKKQGENEAQARAFLAKLIKDYGDKAVANSIAQLSLKPISPAEIHSYLIGILRKQQDSTKKSNRGSVSL